MDISNDRFLRPGEVCKILKISRATLWNWHKSGTLPATLVVGSTCRWSEKDLNNMANPSGFKTTSKLD